MKPKLLILFLMSSFIQTIAQNNSLSLVHHWADGPCLTSYEYQGLLYIGNGGILEILEIDSTGSPNLIGSVVTSSVVKDVFVLDSLAYIAGYNLGLQIVNVSNPSEPELLGSVDTPGSVLSVFVSGNYAYLGERHGLRVVDISNPALPILAGFYSFGSFPTHDAFDVWVIDSLVYVANSNGGLKILEISDLNNIYEIGAFDALHSRGLFVEGEYLYLVSLLGGFYIIDISDPTDPIEVFKSPSGYGAQSIVKRDDFLYTSGMSVWDISDLSNPTEVGNWFSGVYYGNTDISLFNNFACLSSKSEGLRILDISSPITIHTIGNIGTSGSAKDVFVNNNFAFVADGSEGLQIIDVSEPTEPVHVAQFFTDGDASYIQGVEDIVYLSDYDCFRVVDVSNPYVPNELGSYSPNSGLVSRFDILNSRAYICASYGLKILDISDPSVPVEIGSYWIGTGFMQSPTSVSVSGDVACIYIYDDWVTENQGVYLVDISNAQEPETIGFLQKDEIVNDLKYQNNLVYMVTNTGKLTILDVSDISQPIEISYLQFDYPLTSIKIRDQRAYVVPEETGGDLIIVDVSDPYSLIEIDSYNKINHFSKNVFISDTLAYMASTWSGMYILDVSMQGDLSISGQFETRGTSQQINKIENHLYLANGGGGVGVFEIDSTGTFAEVGFFEFDGDASGIAVSDNYAFVADWDNGLRILDIQDLNNVTQVGFFEGYFRKVDVQGNYAYTTSNGQENIFDISNVNNPVLCGSLDGGIGWNITVNGPYAYYAGGNSGLHIYNVSNPNSPYEVAQYDYGDSVFDVEVVDTVAYLANGTLGLRLLGIANPSNPQELDFYIHGNVKSVRVENGLAYITVQDYGLQVVDVSDPLNIFLVAEYLSGGEPSDVLPYSDFVYLADGDDGIHVLQADFTTNIKYYNSKNSVQNFELLQNIPNPYSQNTLIRYKVFEKGYLSLSVFDNLGNKTVIFKNKFELPGDYEVEFENVDLPQGIYFYQLSDGKQTLVRKMVKL